MMRTDALKPCPFCGNAHEVYCNEDGRYVHCGGCGISTKDYDSLEEACTAWNRRTPSASAQGVDHVALANAIIREMCELCDRTSPEDEPDAMIANASEMHGCVERALEILCVTTSVDTVRDAAFEEEARAVERHDKTDRGWVNGSLWDTLTNEACARIRALKSKKEA